MQGSKDELFPVDQKKGIFGLLRGKITWVLNHNKPEQDVPCFYFVGCSTLNKQKAKVWYFLPPPPWLHNICMRKIRRRHKIKAYTRLYTMIVN